MRTTEPYISVIFNCDTRDANKQFGGTNLQGVVSPDFLTDSLYNKIKFFEGFDIEVICCIDVHNPIPEDALKYIQSVSDCVLIRKHTGEQKFNDNNYQRAFALASGKYVCKIDQDTACFTNSKEYVQELIDFLEQYSYIGYPSMFSPNPDHNDNYDYWWCSTRWMLYKRETLDLTELKKCLSDSDYMYGKYPASVLNPWTEHVIGLMAKYNGNGVHYPKIETDKGLIFSWGSYDNYILRRLNELPYNGVVDWVNSKGGLVYPNDVFAA